jgi:hypothetical protein
MDEKELKEIRDTIYNTLKEAYLKGPGFLAHEEKALMTICATGRLLDMSRRREEIRVWLTGQVVLCEKFMDDWEAGTGPRVTWQDFEPLTDYPMPALTDQIATAIHDYDLLDRIYKVDGRNFEAMEAMPPIPEEEHRNPAYVEMGRVEKQRLLDCAWQPGKPGEAADIDTEAARRRFYRMITGGKTFEQAMEIFNGKKGGDTPQPVPAGA